MPHRLAAPALALLVVCVSSAALAHGEEARQLGAHVHGVAELGAALDGERLVVELRSPLANIAGFEHEPRDAAEKAALDKALGTLNRGDMVAPTAAAGCVIRGVEVLQSRHAEGHDHGNDHGHKHDDKHDHKDDHKDAHDHKDGHDHAGEGHGGEGHADVTATWTYACSAPAALEALQVNLFQHFQGLEKVDASFVGPAKQTAATLTAGSALFTLR